MLTLVMALLLAISTVGCAKSSPDPNRSATATTRETSSDEQSATEAWDSISDDETEATAQTEATEPAQSHEVTEEQQEPETTLQVAKDPTEPTANPDKPAVEDEDPPAQTQKPPAATEPAEEIPTEEESELTEPPTAEPPATEPPVTEPTITEPADVVDINALISYGRSYAVITYGYESSPGTREGYYPAYVCGIGSMEEGYQMIKKCVDDTTRALLARPGSQIVVEINGVLYRAKIDIVITDLGSGNYSVTVYYG